MTRSSWGLDLLTDDRDWLSAAACGPDTAEWFWITSPRGKLTEANRLALRLCRGCPVLGQCALDAETHPMPWTHIAGGQVRGDK